MCRRPLIVFMQRCICVVAGRRRSWWIQLLFWATVAAAVESQDAAALRTPHSELTSFSSQFIFFSCEKLGKYFFFFLFPYYYLKFIGSSLTAAAGTTKI